ncbi:AraC family transcriptional regulator [Pseudomonas sp. C27(2019)]|uniref:AraC family transcriptional regulator n=1 Tax=Pseudomonas sp. C27(2019) TaxID=2604941 RepID=UPI001248DDC6|nr:AraC family transcriptional regulator [Pseudomonas sp. C27(2019)]QEY59224.1 AraC family transcriptional regulator [Pseudomonas sp. C27(2019)]
MYFINASCTNLLVTTLAAEGLNIEQLCRQVGLEAHLLQNEDSLFERRVIYRLLELAAAAANNPDIGLKTYTHSTLGDFHLVGYTMMSSANLKQALEHFVHFIPLLSNGFTATFNKEKHGCMSLSWLSHPETGSIEPRQFVDATTAALLGFCRCLLGNNVSRPQMIEFDYPEPENINTHRDVFDCSLRFGSERNRIFFSMKDLLLPLSTANETLAVMHRHAAEKKMKRLFGHSLSSRVQSLLVKRLSQGGANLESIAAILCMSKRTLQRGLTEEGEQFTILLKNTRIQLADHYLRRTQHKLAEVARLLGFNDQSALHKACLRWFGMTPGRYRTAYNRQQSAKMLENTLIKPDTTLPP